jgi:hypothetical protein
MRQAVVAGFIEEEMVHAAMVGGREERAQSDNRLREHHHPVPLQPGRRLTFGQRA